MNLLDDVKKEIGFDNSYDFIERIVKSKEAVFNFLFNETLSDTSKIQKAIKEFLPFLDKINKSNCKALIFNAFPVENIERLSDTYEIVDHLFNGDLVIFCENFDLVVALDTKSYPKRSVAEPDGEKVVRGSRDGFTEVLNVNVGLLRRRIKSGHLVFKTFEIGKYTKTKVVLTYLDNVIDEKTLSFILEKLTNLKVLELTMTDKALEELLVGKNITPYPLVKYTERPDTLAMHLYQGMFGIIVDTSPSVILGPVSVFDHLQHAEEFRQTIIAGTYLRLIRILGIIIAFFSVPVWFALSTINFKHHLFDKLFNPDVNYHFLFLQLVTALIGIELIRMASIHTPNALSTSMGLVSGIIIGDMAVSVGLFSEQVVILSAISAIGSFITPSYELSLANKMASLFLTIIVYFFKLPGLIIGVVLLLIHLALLKSFNHSYLYPLIPFNFKALLKQLIRVPYNHKEKVKK